MTDLRPLSDRVLVKCEEGATKTPGGLLIPDNAKEKPAHGKVVAVGSGRVLPDGSVRKVDVSVGDKVLYSKYSGTEVKLAGEDYLVIREDDILGILQ